MMTVGELIQALREFPSDLPVLLSADEEGNSFSTLSDVDDCLYDPNTPYYIDQIYITHADLDLALVNDKGYYTEEDRAPEGSIPAVVLWP